MAFFSSRKQINYNFEQNFPDCVLVLNIIEQIRDTFMSLQFETNASKQ